MPISGDSSQLYDQLPTIKKFCQQSDDSINGKRFIVTSVWFPNQYPSFTLDSNQFRLRLSDSSPIYAELISFAESAIEAGLVFTVQITDRKKAAFVVDLLSDEKGDWEELGEFGRKLIKVHDKAKKSSTKRSS